MEVGELGLELNRRAFCDLPVVCLSTSSVGKKQENIAEHKYTHDFLFLREHEENFQETPVAGVRNDILKCIQTQDTTRYVRTFFMNIMMSLICSTDFVDDNHRFTFSSSPCSRGNIAK